MACQFPSETPELSLWRTSPESDLALKVMKCHFVPMLLVTASQGVPQMKGQGNVQAWVTEGVVHGGTIFRDQLLR